MDILNSIVHMDALDLCDCLEDDSIDMILCDLPYGITACEWDNVIPLEPMWECFKRVIKPRGAVVLTASQPFTSQLVMSNLEWFKYEWIWGKNKAGMFIHANNRPLSAHENILVFSGGVVNHKTLTSNRMSYYPVMAPGKQWVRITRSKPSGTTVGIRKSHEGYIGKARSGKGKYPTTVLHYPKSNLDNSHPSQKPVALFEYLIRTYTQSGEIVFDPCVGSGTTAMAARNCGRQFIVGDNSAEYVKIARDRLAKPYTLPMFDKPVAELVPKQLTLIE
jgi:site-specific DNA-methyltransferase (adenine-specific)